MKKLLFLLIMFLQFALFQSSLISAEQESAIEITNREAREQAAQNQPAQTPQQAEQTQPAASPAQPVSAPAQPTAAPAQSSNTTAETNDPIAALFKKSLETQNIEEKKKIRLEIMRKSPMSAYGYFCRAWLEELKTGNPEAKKRFTKQAIVYYTKAIEINPLFAEAYSERGNAYGNLKQYQEAIADFTKAIEINPKFWEAYYLLGFIYHYYQWSSENIQKCIELYTKSIELRPDFARAYKARAYIYFETGKYQEALADYDRAIELGIKTVETYRFRALVKAKLKNYFQAIEDYKIGIKLAKLTNNHFDWGICLRGIANAYMGLKKYYAAINYFKKELALRLKNAKNINERKFELRSWYTFSDGFKVGLLYLDLYKYELALAEGKKGIEYAPDSAFGYFTAGLACYELNKYHEAIKFLTTAIKFKRDLSPNGIKHAYKTRAKAYRSINKPGLAETDEAQAEAIEQQMSGASSGQNQNADYTDPRKIIADGDNAVGKTAYLDGEYSGINSERFWFRVQGSGLRAWVMLDYTSEQRSRFVRFLNNYSHYKVKFKITKVESDNVYGEVIDIQE